MGHRTDKTRTEDLTTDQRANRHATKSAPYSEEAQNVNDDNVGDVQPLQNADHARNKANTNKGEESPE